MASRYPWLRIRPEYEGNRFILNTYIEKFDSITPPNLDLDVDTKRAALKVSAAVVSLVSFTDGKLLFMGSGTIVECTVVNGTYLSTILTSASLLRSSSSSNVAHDIKVDVHLSDGTLFEGEDFLVDFHYNIATLKVKSKTTLPTATLRLLDDSISVDPNEIRSKDKPESSQLRPHRNLFNLCPGDKVIALGRYHEKPYDLMTAPGRFSLECCGFDCKDLFKADCKISKCGTGGPLINPYGEVIGLNFYDELCTPFLPINITSKCLEHFAMYGKFCRPSLGIEATNLYAATGEKLETIMQKFPDIFYGVLVENVEQRSPAGMAGLYSGDVIIECGGSIVRSFLEFVGIIFDKVGESVDVVVIREGSDALVTVKIPVGEISAENFYSWPLPKEYSTSSESYLQMFE